MVLTLESLASMLHEPLYTEAGVRRFGGHTPRVTGAQALAALGIEVAKIQILARRSSDAIMRYVAEAPLATLRHDLGLTSQTPHAFTNRAKSIAAKVKHIDDVLADHDKRIAACESIVFGASSSETTAGNYYIQNAVSLAIHSLPTQTSTSTRCGWDYTRQSNAGKIAKGVSLASHRWWNL